MRDPVFGDILLAAVLRVKYDSANTFILRFWDDASKTVPSGLVGATITIEVDVDGTPLVWTAVTDGNTATWNLARADTTFAWRSKRYRVMFEKSGQKRAVLSGDVRVQV